MKKILAIIFVLFVQATASAQDTLLYENFPNPSFPLDWSIDSAGVAPVIGWNFTGMPNGITDGDFSGDYPRIKGFNNSTINCNINTPVFSASTASTVYLSFSEQSFGDSTFSNQYAARSIDVSNDSGNTWINVERHHKHNYPFRKMIINISQIAAGYPNVGIRFNFTNVSVGTWAIDNILVSDSLSCTNPADSGWAWSNHAYECTGSTANLFLYNLSRGIGQTYQWELKNASTGNVYTPVAGAVYDTVSVLQNGITYYRCLVGCAGSTAYSNQLLLEDTPGVASVYSPAQTDICAGKNDTLHIDNDKSIAGITYQWKWAPPLGTYSNIAGANSSTYIVSAANYSSETYFNCDVICIQSNAATTAWPPRVAYVNLNPLCYCTANSQGDCSNMMTVHAFLEYVAIQNTTLHYTGTCQQNYSPIIIYSFYPPQDSATATLMPGATYSIIAALDTMSGYVGMWLDADKNGVFDTYEYTDIGFANTFTGIVPTANFTVPTNAALGLTGLRVRNNWYPNDSTNGCTFLLTSSTNDYLITIDTAVSVLNYKQGQMTLQLYPNPAKDKLTVSTIAYGDYTIELFNPYGSLLYRQSSVVSRQLRLDVSNYAEGIYFVKVSSEKGVALKKFVKKKE